MLDLNDQQHIAAYKRSQELAERFTRLAHDAGNNIGEALAAVIMVATSLLNDDDDLGKFVMSICRSVHYRWEQKTEALAQAEPVGKC